MIATERRSLDEVLARLPDIQERTKRLLARLRPHVALGPGRAVLDIGAAQGLHVVALRREGLEACGLEPWQEAVDASREIAERTDTPIPMSLGTAERLPYDDASFDLVIAVSVMEHVDDPDQVFREVRRVLRPGGGFYFYTSSAVSPRQNEIRGFPAFSWYPGPVKRRILDWAMENRPAIIGNTEKPAYHWYTPWGSRRRLRAAGFDRVIDRWELRRPEEAAGAKLTAQRAVQRSRALRLAADVVVPESGYLALIAP